MFAAGTNWPKPAAESKTHVKCRCCGAKRFKKGSAMPSASAKYHWPKRVGQTVVIPHHHGTSKNVRSAAANYFKKRGWRYKTRRVEKGVEVTRLPAILANEF